MKGSQERSQVKVRGSPEENPPLLKARWYGSRGLANRRNDQPSNQRPRTPAKDYFAALQASLEMALPPPPPVAVTT
jgi:hypothetical protein